MNTDREAIQLAVKTVLRKKPEEVRMVHIRNTLELTDLQVSTNMLEEVRSQPDRFEIRSEAQAWRFQPDGVLDPVASAH